MSMVWAWERILGNIDKVETERRDEDAVRAPAQETEDAPPTLRCRACNYEGAELYCPHCLADTMQQVRRRRD
jgi:hypothetical protein